MALLGLASAAPSAAAASAAPVVGAGTVLAPTTTAAFTAPTFSGMQSIGLPAGTGASSIAGAGTVLAPAAAGPDLSKLVLAMGAAGAGAQVFQGIAGQREANRAADAAKDMARIDANRLRTQRARQLAGMRAQIGASGVTFQGTPLALLADQAAEAGRDVALTRFKGDIEASNLRNKGTASLIGGIGAGVQGFGNTVLMSQVLGTGGRGWNMNG